MSQDRARACIEQMKTDAAFRDRVLAAEGPAARMRMINAEGFACSAEEFQAASAELSDTELSHVSGGLGALGVKDHSV